MLLSNSSLLDFLTICMSQRGTVSPNDELAVIQTLAMIVLQLS